MGTTENDAGAGEQADVGAEAGADAAPADD